MTYATALFITGAVLAAGCATMGTQRLEDINPIRVYHMPYGEVFTMIKLYSYKEGFTLDRFGEDAGRVIGHKSTISSSEAKQLSTTADNELVIMNLKVRRIDSTSTEVHVNFAFENGHVVVSREEESILLDSYHTFFKFMGDDGGI